MKKYLPLSLFLYHILHASYVNTFIHSRSIRLLHISI